MTLSWNNRLNHWIWASLDLLFPPSCGGCNRTGSRWCLDCQNQVRLIPKPVCRICGRPIPLPGVCTNCQEIRPPFHMMRSWLVFEGPIRQALHAIKYRRNLPLGETLASFMFPVITEFDWSFDMVIPVPLGKKRMQERGYNQAGIIAKPLAALGRWEYVPKALARIRETRSQVGLSIAERRENVTGAFKGNQDIIYGREILVIDDIATTGATLMACSHALLEAGARSIYAFSLARAVSLST